MLKTLRKRFKQDNEKFSIPHSVQQAIPIQTIWKDGIFCVGKDKYSKSYKFTDVNYAVASQEDKQGLFLSYQSLLNYLDPEATTKLSVSVRRMNHEEFEQMALIPPAGDGLDHYREEYNRVILDRVEGANGMVRELYLTMTIYRKNIDEARAYFQRVTSGLISHFGDIGSVCTEMNAIERLQVLHDFYRPGEESNFKFDIKENAKLGHDFKDYICSDSFEFEDDYFRMGEQYGRVLYLKHYAGFIGDDILTIFTDINKQMIISIDILPIPLNEAVREVENRLLGVETNITNWQRRQNANNNFSAIVPYDMETQRKESREFLDDLMFRDQRMTFAVLTIVHIAETKKQLDLDTDTLLTTARNRMCQCAVLRFQQLDGLNTVLPIGVRKINAIRTLLTESLGSLMPFRAQEVIHPGGIYSGVNALSRNLILINRERLMNPSSFVLGVPGSGKSMYTKMLIIFLSLATTDQILIYDPENEYQALVEALGGATLSFMAGGTMHLNAMDMVKGYGDKNPIIDKSQFILSLYEQITKGSDTIGAMEKSILDRCVDLVYKQRDKLGVIPTFQALRQILQGQPEPEAKDLALMLELFTDGSMNIFAHPTNVDIDNRIICFNTRDMSEDMRDLGQLVITDHMINRVASNWENGTRTHVILDEFHTLLQHEYSANFFDSAYRRFRKRDAWVTSLTQNVNYLLESLAARNMLSNSELVVMLNQSSKDQEDLAALLNISDEQLNYVTNVHAGNGLLRVGSALVPFENQWPKDNDLYKLMTTKPGE